MIKTFTQDDVIRYIYDEISEKRRKDIEKALICDAELQDLYKNLISMKMQLDRSFKSPSDNVITNIMNYSKSLNLQSNK